MPLTQPPDLELMSLHSLADFSGKRVLEVGTGDGRLAWPFAPAAEGWVALDPDVDELKLAAAELQKKLHPNMHLLQGDGRALSFPADYFDLVFFTWSLC